jgi:nucleoside-diphosphate-sugar epimerase
MLTREKTRELLASWEMSTDRAREELGFESAIPLAQGVEQTYEWYRQHGWL